MMTARIAASELSSSNPKIRSIGVERALGITLAMSSGTLITAMLVSAMLDDEEDWGDDIIDAIRLLGPSYDIFGNIIPLSKNNSGNWDYWNVNNNLSHGYIFDMITAAMMEFEGDYHDPTFKNENSVVSFVTSFFESPFLRASLSPYLSNDVFTDAVLECINNRGGKIYNWRTQDMDEIIISCMDHIWGKVKPGVFKTMERIFDPERNTVNELIAGLLGFRRSNIDAAESIVYKLNSAKTEINNIISGYDPEFDKDEDGDGKLDKQYEMIDDIRDNIEYIQALLKAGFTLGIEGQVVEYQDGDYTYTTEPKPDDENLEKGFKIRRIILENSGLNKEIIRLITRDPEFYPEITDNEIYNIISATKREEILEKEKLLEFEKYKEEQQ